MKSRTDSDHSPTIALLSIGNELLDGRVVNTNASQLAGKLHALGIDIAETRAVPDTLEAIVEALHELAIHKHVIVTGGLGPTSDDITAQAASIAFGDPCRFHPKAEQAIRTILKKLKFPFTQTQRRQAYLPSGAKIFPNEWGIAPGFSLQVMKANFHFLPGVPRECLPMFDKYVLPKVKRMSTRQKLMTTLLWRTFGKREADLFDSIRPVLTSYEKKFGKNFVFSSQVPFPCVDVKIEFWSGRDKKSASRAEIAKFERALCQKLDRFTYARKPISLAEAVLDLLRKHKLTLGTAESCTGGMLGEMLTAIPGASDVYFGGVIVYNNQVKEALLGVKAATLRRYGAVSKDTAIEMARGARDALHTDYALSLTGISGPGGGSAQKPVGTIYVGLSDAASSNFQHRVIFQGRGDRLQNRLFASYLALDMLRGSVIQKFEGKKRNGTR